MTGLEMQIAFGTELNQFDERLELHTDDIFHWLNKAQEEFVRSRFETFETDQQVSDDIRSLLKNNVEVVAQEDAGATLLSFKADKAAFPNDYLFYISSRSNIEYVRGECCGKLGPNDINGTRTFDDFCTPAKQLTVSNRVSQQDDIYRLLQDPFNKTTYKSPLCVETDLGVRVYTDDKFIVKKVYFDYIKNPAQISSAVSSELPAFTHRKLVELGVTLFLSNTRGLKERLQRETPTG